MPVVGPHCIEPETFGGGGRTIVGSFASLSAITSSGALELVLEVRVPRRPEFGEHVVGRRIDDGMHGVEAQARRRDSRAATSTRLSITNRRTDARAVARRS